MSTVSGTSLNLSVGELLQGVKPTARKVFLRYRIPPQDAEDLLQQALIAYLHKRDTVHNPQAWTVGTLRNLCLLYWRKRRRNVYDAVDSSLLESLAGGQEPDQEKDDLARDLDLLVSDLPHRCQSILALRYRLGCRPKEAAHQLGYQASSIYKLTERCLAALSRSILASGLVRDRQTHHCEELTLQPAVEVGADTA